MCCVLLKLIFVCPVYSHSSIHSEVNYLNLYFVGFLYLLG